MTINTPPAQPAANDHNYIPPESPIGNDNTTSTTNMLPLDMNTRTNETTATEFEKQGEKEIERVLEKDVEKALPVVKRGTPSTWAPNRTEKAIMGTLSVISFMVSLDATIIVTPLSVCCHENSKSRDIDIIADDRIISWRQLDTRVLDWNFLPAGGRSYHAIHGCSFRCTWTTTGPDCFPRQLHCWISALRNLERYRTYDRWPMLARRWWWSSHHPFASHILRYRPYEVSTKVLWHCVSHSRHRSFHGLF
jgi:hypothetical protein